MGTRLSLLLVLAFAAAPRSAAEWEVRRSPEKRRAIFEQKIYGSAKTQEDWDRAFRKALSRHDAPMVRRLLVSGKRSGFTVDLNARDDKGRTLLHQAAAAGRSSMVAALMDFGADPDLKDDAGEAPLAAALAARDKAMLKVLTQTPRKLDFKIGEHALEDWVFEKDSVAGLNLLYPQADPLHRAAATGAVEIARYLLSTGADPWRRDNALNPAFLIALKNRNKSVLKLFLDKDPSIVSFREEKTGDTLLHIALDTVQPDIAELLLRYNPSLDTRNLQAQRPMDIAANLSPTLDANDPALREKWARLYKILSGQASPGSPEPGLPSLVAIQDAIRRNDLKAFRGAAPFIRDDEAGVVFESLIARKMFPFITELLRAKNKLFAKSSGNTFNRPEMYAIGNWPLFEAMYKALGPASFNACAEKQCPMSLLLRAAPPEFLKKAAQLKPPINFNAAVAPQGKLPLDELDRILAEETESLKAGEAVKRVSTADAILDLRRKREFLLGIGARRAEDEKRVLEKLESLLAKGEGSKILKEYDAKTLAQLKRGYALGLSVAHDDPVLAEALLKHLSQEDIAGLEIHAFTSPAMRAVLARLKVSTPEKGLCLHWVRTLRNDKGSKRLMDWIRQGGPGRCKDLQETVEALVLGEWTQPQDLLDALYAIPEVVALIPLTTGFSGETLLHLAAHHCHELLVEKLLSLKADPNRGDSSGKSSLFHAVKGSPRPCEERVRRRILEKLVAAGADLNRPDTYGKTVLERAVSSYGRRPWETIEHLLKLGADPYKVFKGSGRTLFEEVIVQGIINPESLLKAGIRPLTVRSCAPEGFRGDWDLSRYYDVGRNTFNDVIMEYRRDVAREARNESCDAVRARVEQEYAQRFTSFGQLLEGWRKALVKAQELAEKESKRGKCEQCWSESEAFQAGGMPRHGYFAGVPACCGLAWEDDGYCLSRLVCEEMASERQLFSVLCDRFNEVPRVDQAWMSLLEQETTKDEEAIMARHGIVAHKTVMLRLNVENEVLLSMSVPLDPGKKGIAWGRPATEKMNAYFDEQSARLYKTMRLGSLEQYVAWRYPQCSGHAKEWQQAADRSAKNLRAPADGRTKGAGARPRQAVPAR